MPILQTSTAWGDTFPPVIARALGMRSPMSIDIDISHYPVQKLFPPGFFAGTQVAIAGATPPITLNADKYRILPRTKITVINGNTLTVTPFTAAIFVVGEVLTAIDATTGAAGAAVGTIQSINHAANTITLTAAPGAGAVVANTIGNQASSPVMANGNRLGLITPNTALDMSLRANTQFGLFSSVTVYRGRLPYVDAYLAGLYPEIQFV